MTLFLVGISCIRAIWVLASNTTMIEGWEIERHSRLMRRSRTLGGYLDGPDGIKIKMERQEFPYDVGIWVNICQGMGSKNPLAWIWPFAATPHSNGLEFDVNEFEDADKSWPPPDPDRMPRQQRTIDSDGAFTYPQTALSNYDEVQAFKKRQANDLKRRQGVVDVRRRKPFYRRDFSAHNRETGDLESDQESGSGEEAWRDSGGNGLADYGVDEQVEFYDEDDVPLAELIRRRKAKTG